MSGTEYERRIAELERLLRLKIRKKPGKSRKLDSEGSSTTVVNSSDDCLSDNSCASSIQSVGGSRGSAAESINSVRQTGPTVLCSPCAPSTSADGSLRASLPQTEIDILAPGTSSSFPSTSAQVMDVDGYTTVTNRKRLRSEKSRINESSDDTVQESSGKISGDTARAPQSDKKEGRIPPIFITTKSDWLSLANSLRQANLHYAGARSTADGVRIQPSDSGNFRGIVRLLESLKIPFHSFSLKSELNLKVVLRGILETISTDEVKSDLISQGFTPINVSRMKRDKKPMPLVLVEVPRSEKNLFDVKSCCGLLIKAEAPRRKEEVGQCHRCQRFGHAQKGCRSDPKCVKCAGPHMTAECKKKRNSTPAKCANCQGAHTANYKGCPVKAVAQRKRASGTKVPHNKQNKKLPTKVPLPPAPPPPPMKRSFASVLRPTISVHTAPVPPQMPVRKSNRSSLPNDTQSTLIANLGEMMLTLSSSNFDPIVKGSLIRNINAMFQSITQVSP